jgi:predicted  nucleic acid-binding Zn-ribbon protein
MTKPQKEMISLQRENKKLKRDNFILKQKVEELEKQDAAWQRDKTWLVEKMDKMESDLEDKLDRADPGWKRRL